MPRTKPDTKIIQIYNVPSAVHAEARRIAFEQGISMNKWLIQALAAHNDMLEALQNIEANLTGRDCFPERVESSLKYAREAIRLATLSTKSSSTAGKE